MTTTAHTEQQSAGVVAVSGGGLVLVHGAIHDASCWDPVLAHVTTPAVAVDLPGRGSHPADIIAVTLGDCVGAVIGAADLAGFDRFALVGHSLGGVTITETAVLTPGGSAGSSTSEPSFPDPARARAW